MWVLGTEPGSSKEQQVLLTAAPQFLQTVNKRASEQETPLTMHSVFLRNALTSTTQNSLMVVPRRTANLKYKHRLYFRASESQPPGDGPRKLFFP